MAELVTGIDLPHSPISRLRQQLQTALASPDSDRKIVVFGCDHGASVDTLRDRGVAVFSLVCTGMLPPSFVEYALHDGASGVLVSGCRAGGCEFRLGQKWAEARLLGMREPHLRAAVPRDCVLMVWADAGDEAALRLALSTLRQRLAAFDRPVPLAEPI